MLTRGFGKIFKATDRKALVKGQVLDLNGNVLVTAGKQNVYTLLIKTISKFAVNVLFAVGLFVVPKSLGLEKLQSFKDESAAK